MKRTFTSALILIGMTGCVSTGQVGILSRSGDDPAALITQANPYEEVGLTSGRACRHFLLNLIPFGDAAVSTAVDEALAAVGGDALINVVISSSLFGFIPYYNLYAFTCTSVRGTAVRFVADVSPESVTP
jgi:hypothetical protein